MELIIPTENGDITEEEMFRQLQVRHKKRQAVIDYANEKQRQNKLFQGATKLTK